MRPVNISAGEYNATEVVFAKDQPEYLPLPALSFRDGLIVTCWSLTWRERLRLLFGGNVFLGTLTFNKALQPVRLSTSIEGITGFVAGEKTHG
jgi:hypothetical protein